ncbi:MAG: amidohydrolase, partial [Planctomycetes bacterium]|nr:amidohydrolase [Planctomycetota bacterium]
MNALKAAQAIQDWLTEKRRTLHMMPELSLHEFKTAEYVALEFEKLGLKVTRNLWGEGFIADLEAPNAAGRVALRADMDALAIQELNDIPYRSKHDGIAHMCGHDTHMAIALGSARVLSENKSALTRSVRFLLQPSEELPPGGALGLIENGCLKDVDEVYGLHNQPLLQAGKIATCVGPLTATADLFTIQLHGKGGHAARPHLTLDPIPAGAALISSLQTIISRGTAANQSAVLSVTRITSGTTHNIVPDLCELEGTVRTFSAADRERIESSMERMVKGVAEAHGLRGELKYLRGYDSIVNHESGVAAVSKAACAVLGQENVNTEYPAQTWGEDFSYY